VNPGDEVADDLLTDLVGHIVFVVGGGIPLGLQECPGVLGALDGIPQAMRDEDGLGAVSWKSFPDLVRVSDRTAEGHQACEEVGPAQPASIGHGAALRKSKEKRAARGYTVFFHDFLKEAVQFVLGVDDLLWVVAPWFRPCETDHARLQLDGNRSVGACVYIAVCIYQPGKFGKVIHVCSKTVQEDD